MIRILTLVSLVLIGLLFDIKLCNASLGDVDYSFRVCLSTCMTDQFCNNEYDDNVNVNNLSIYLTKVTWLSWIHDISHFPSWDCDSYCKYTCIETISTARKSEGLPVLKFYGHWPVKRHFGLEEPASVLFSILNGFSYIVIILTHSRQTARHYMNTWLFVHKLICINAWLFSAIYHAQKTELTSLFDYISALLLLSYSLWLVIRRIWGRDANAYVVGSAFMIGASLVCYRIKEMIGDRVSYNEHMTLCITISITHVVLWLLLASYQLFVISKDTQLISSQIPSRTSAVDGDDSNLKVNRQQLSTKSDGSSADKDDDNYVHDYTRRKWYLCIFCQVWFVLAAMLELFDFPPIIGELCEAHSLWHLATVPLGYVWYAFWAMDSTHQ